MFLIIENIIISYNKQDFTTSITCKEAEFFNIKIKEKSIENIHLVKSNHEFANQIWKGNIKEFKEVKNQLTNINTVPEKLARIKNLLLNIK